jgi:hypothetical protein
MPDGTSMPDATSTDPPDPAVAPRGLTESEDFPWTRKIPNHPPRKDSPAYVAARSLMNKLALGLAGFLYGDKPFEDHHGGGLWLKDEQGWFVVRNIAGIEWSAQFCADPAKVDLLRQNARRLYDKFPDAVAELGIRDLLDTPITDAAGVAVWTDSICNASVPLPAPAHRGILPAFGGIHHYPAPVAEIAFFKYDDFDLWVTDAQGNEVAVTPVAPRGSGNGQVQVLDAPASSTLAAVRTKAWEQNLPAVVPATDRVAEEAYGEQYAKLATGTVAPDDPLAAAALPGA